WNPELSDEEREEAIREALAANGRTIFREEAMSELTERLRDVAYALEVSEDPRGRQLLSIAHTFGLRGEDSDYATWLIHQTARDLSSNLTSDEFDVVGDSAGFPEA